MSWNAGGLSRDRYQQLLLWLQGSGKYLHIVAVQETHWRHDANFQAHGWLAFHFPYSDHDKSAGILILVNQLMYPKDKVQLTCLVEGRLIHLRLELNPSIDVLILYQHLFCTSAKHKGQEGLQHAQAQRSKIWTKVHQSLSGFPSRNSVLLIGDFNTDLFPDPPHVGPGVRTRLSKQPPDQHEFQQLLTTFSLCALNCWRRAGTQAQTFLPATGHRGTRIDFILTRLPQADGQARTCAPTWLPFVEDTGMRHLPLLGSIPAPSLPKQRHKTARQVSLSSVRQALRIYPDLAPTYTSKATQLLRHSTPDTISDKLLEAWLQCQPPSCLQPSGPGAHTQTILHLWELRRARRIFHSSRAPNDLSPWPLESELRSKTKALKLACKQSQQDRIQRILSEAEQAAHKGLTAVYQVVRKLAPKSTRKPILFRDSTGAPLSTEQEVKSLKDYFRALYLSDKPEAPPPGNFFPAFTEAELQSALLHLPQGKALPPWVAPSPLWALAATPIAEALHPALQVWCDNMQNPMPGDWPTSALCLLNKPSKPPKAPENLRPIALLRPVSKCLATLAAERLRPYVYDPACRFPQFAYVSMRSVEDAIERACAHCATARAMLEGQKYNLHRRREGHKAGHCRGGLTLSLDLSRAFDCLPREVLHASLRFAQVDADLIDLILHTHRHSKLLIDHKDAVVMFFRPASRMSIIPLLAKKSEHWHELKAQKDAELSLALRTFLFRSMFDAIQERLQETVKNPTQLEAAQQLQVFLPDKEGEPLRIPYLMFNTETRQLEPKKDQAPLTLERVVEILAAILKHSLDSLAILCFHPTQKLAAPIQGPTLPFLLQVGNRSKASFELYENLILLANSALWQLVGGSLRTERMSRSPLATELQKHLQRQRALIRPTASIENRNNHCYANATLQAIHWLCSFLPATQEIWDTAMRTVMLRMSHQVRIPDLWTVLPWSLAHSSWKQPHRQHDAAEYLSFFRRFLIPDLVTGGWQRRILHQDSPVVRCEVTDCGETWPLFISTPISQLSDETRLNLTVQKLLHIWQGEAEIGVMALSEAPMLLSLQLNRFHGASEHPDASSSIADSPLKDTSRIILDMRISLPCFQNPCEPSAAAIATYLVHYRLHAVLIHQGATAQSGHYRAFLTSGNLPRLQYLCDDGKTASCVSGETPDEVMTHGYILLYLRCNP